MAWKRSSVGRQVEEADNETDSFSRDPRAALVPSHCAHSHNSTYSRLLEIQRGQFGRAAVGQGAGQGVARDERDQGCGLLQRQWRATLGPGLGGGSSDEGG